MTSTFHDFEIDQIERSPDASHVGPLCEEVRRLRADSEDLLFHKWLIEVAQFFFCKEGCARYGQQVLFDPESWRDSWKSGVSPDEAAYSDMEHWD